MTPANDTLDTTRLQHYLAGQIPDFGTLLECSKFSGGQSNPTYLLRTPGRQYVLRRKPAGVLLKSAHAVDREYRVIKAMGPTAVPVPQVYCLCEDEGVIGSMFYVMEFMDGRIFWDGALPAQTPPERTAIYEASVSVLAALHSVDVNQVGLGDYGKPGNYFARQTKRWSEQYLATATEDNPAMNRLMQWLPNNMPADDGRVSLAHGDYRIDNLVFHPTEPRVLAVLDWELSTLGHPLADFAYHCMTWRVTPAEFRGLKGHDLAALGIPREDSYVQAYCKRTGRDSLPDWDYYMAFNMFRMAAILQGILHRALQGSAASAEAEQTGRLARPMAEAGWRQVMGHPSER